MNFSWKRKLFLFCVLAWVAPTTANAQFGRQFYTSWKWDEVKQRHHAFYYFKSNVTDTNYKKQVIYHYSKDVERRPFIYYYNIETGKYWGRCCSQHHARYNPKHMIWNFAKDAAPGKNWGPLTPGAPKIPKSSDGARMEMVPDAPDPPK